MDFQHDKPRLVAVLLRLPALLPPRLRAHILLLALLVPTVVLVHGWSSKSPSPAVATTAAVLPAASVATQATNPAAPPAAPAWHTYTVAKGDTLSTIFQKQGFGVTTLHQMLTLGKPVKPLLSLRPGEQVRFLTDAQGKLQAVAYGMNDLDTLMVEESKGNWQARVDHLQPTQQMVVKQGKVRGSLSTSMRAAGIPSSMVAEFTNIFHWKVDFRRDLRAGASFAVIYQKLTHNGKEVGRGPIEAAELTRGDNTLRVYRFEDGRGGYNYYTSEGSTLKPAFLRTPVQYTRISSTFSLDRWHPILHVWRPHYGVDLAARTGAPVKAAADGVVKFVGWSDGYGRLVELRNMGPYSTRYGHLSGFAKGLRDGERVHQGQVIGYVGESGEATGPHLHFEIRVNDKPYDPLKVALPDGSPLPRALMAEFKQSIHPLLLVLRDPGSSDAEQQLAVYGKQQLVAVNQRQSDRRDL